MKENLLLLGETTTKLARNASTQGIEAGAQQVKYVGNTDVFCFGFYFLSPKWTRPKFVIDISIPRGHLMPTSCTEVLRVPLHIF